MPEIVEVKKYVDIINKYVKNKTINDIIVNDKKYTSIKQVKNEHIINVMSKGKFIYFQLSDDSYIGNTLGLSGGWTIYKNKFILPTLLNKMSEQNLKHYLQISFEHIRVKFIFDDFELYYFDLLNFGTIKLFTKKELDEKLGSIGQEIMDPELSFNNFNNLISKYPNKSIGTVVMNQKIISGIGNYIRAEILWMSKINPLTKISNLTKNQLINLFSNARKYTWGTYDRKRAIKEHLLKETDKLPIDYNRDFFIYRQTTDIYGNTVKKSKLDGRTIYWCDY